MAVLQRDIDRATKKEIVFAEGTIKKVYVKEKEKPLVIVPKSGPNQGKSITFTHERKLLLEKDGETLWVDFGPYAVKAGQEKYAFQFQIKHDDKFLELAPGIELTIYPLKDESWTTESGEKREKWGGKISSINIIDASNARPQENFNPNREQQPAAGGKPSGGASGAGTKVFGEVISIDGGVAQVKTENGLVGPVVLGSNVATVGGRLAAVVDASGNILSGFKAYGPAGQNQGSSSSGSKSAGSFKKDNSGVETGHAVNGALNLHRNGFQGGIVELAKVVHDTTVALKAKERAKDQNKGLSDYDIGAAVGHAVLNATRDVTPNEMDLGEKLTTYAEGLLERVVPDITAYVKAGGAAGILAAEKAAKEEAEAKAKAEAEAKATSQAPAQTATASNHLDMSPPPMDFDDDIPFAPVGLQYARHAIYAV
jgi:hypothetical protein